MEKKYPVLKCTYKLWKEIKPVLESFGITDFSNIGNGKDSYFHIYPFLVTNYGQQYNNKFLMGNTDKQPVEDLDSLRYLVNTKEEFLSAVAELLNKEYKMEERNIKVSLEKAREWYKSNNNTLKELALQVFKEEELKLNTFENILSRVSYNNVSYKTITTQIDKWSALHKLAIIAEYLNYGWKPNWDNNNEHKYFIYKNSDGNIDITSRRNINYSPVYFKSEELARKAIEIMGEEINNIFD